MSIHISDPRREMLPSVIEGIDLYILDEEYGAVFAEFRPHSFRANHSWFDTVLEVLQQDPTIPVTYTQEHVYYVPEEMRALVAQIEAMGITIHKTLDWVEPPEQRERSLLEEEKKLCEKEMTQLQEKYQTIVDKLNKIPKDDSWRCTKTIP